MKDSLKRKTLTQNWEATVMVQVQGGQDISQTKSRTKEAEGMTLRDLWSTNLKEPGDQLDMENREKRGQGLLQRVLAVDVMRAMIEGKEWEWKR